MYKITVGIHIQIVIGIQKLTGRTYWEVSKELCQPIIWECDKKKRDSLLSLFLSNELLEEWEVDNSLRWRCINSKNNVIVQEKDWLYIITHFMTYCLICLSQWISLLLNKIQCVNILPTSLMAMSDPNQPSETKIDV